MVSTIMDMHYVATRIKINLLSLYLRNSIINFKFYALNLKKLPIKCRSVCLNSLENSLRNSKSKVCTVYYKYSLLP